MMITTETNPATMESTSIAVTETSMATSLSPVQKVQSASSTTQTASTVLTASTSTVPSLQVQADSAVPQVSTVSAAPAGPKEDKIEPDPTPTQKGNYYLRDKGQVSF